MRCGCRRSPERRARPRRRSGTGWPGRWRAVRRGSPATSRSAGAMPLRTPVSGSGQRLTSSAYSAAPMPRMSSSGVAVDSVAGKASATSPSMLTRTRPGMVDRQRDAGAVRRLGGRGERLDGAGAADRRRRRVGDLGEGAAADPLRDDQAAGPGVRDVEHPSDAGMLDAAQLHCAGQDFGKLVVGQHGVGIDERERDLAVVGGVHRVPELQVRGSAVEDQQSVATAGDGGTGNQVDVVVAVTRRRRLVGHAERAAVRGSGRRRSPGGRSAPNGGTSSGTSGWKSSADGRGIRVVAPLSDPGTPAESSVTAGPLRVGTPATLAGGPRRTVRRTWPQV